MSKFALQNDKTITDSRFTNSVVIFRCTKHTH